ncbi:MAG: hypothetical protein ABIJ08_01150, partial [Nanoarchaeota archaeon]
MDKVLAELRPNTKKIVLATFSKIITVVVLIFVCYSFINFFVDFRVFDELATALTSLGLEVSALSIAVPFILFGLISLGIVLLLEFLFSGREKYLFYEDHLQIFRNMGIYQLAENTVYYKNIAKITFETIPIAKTGHITLELTGTSEKEFTLQFIDDTQQVASDILRLINQWKARY